MLKVNLCPSWYHDGYHYELRKHPPAGVRYQFKKVERVIPFEAAINEPEKKIADFIQYSRFVKINPDYTPHYCGEERLIHAHMMPVVNAIPFVVDLDTFCFPYLMDYEDYKLILFFRRKLPSAAKIDPKIRLRLNKTKKFLMTPYCKKILAWSNWAREYMLSFVPDREIAGKAEVLYPAVHDIELTRKKSHKYIRIVFTGRAFQRKGGETVLRAFDSLRRDYKNLELIYVGQDTIPSDIYNRYKKINTITFYPVLSKKRLFDVYRKSDIFVLPTSYDSFGMSALEAMNFSLPVVSTRGEGVAAMREIVTDGVSGFLVDLKPDPKRSDLVGSVDFDGFVGKLRMLIEDRKLRVRMGEAGKREIACGRFSEKRRNARLIHIYQEALQ